jgi:hypothetical protein
MFASNFAIPSICHFDRSEAKWRNLQFAAANRREQNLQNCPEPSEEPASRDAKPTTTPHP